MKSAANQVPQEPLEFNFAAIRAGDIVFVYDQLPDLIHRVKRGINVAGQRLLAAMRRQDRLSLKLRTERYSHVMLGMNGGLIIHADGKTVAVELLDDALHMNSGWPSRFRVYRRKGLSPDESEAIVKSAIRYFSNRYSFISYFGSDEHEDTTQFCSRLIAHAFRAIGKPLSSLEDRQVLPIDLFEICRSPEWQDVRSAFFSRPIPDTIDELLSPIEIPGEGTFTLSEFMKNTDRILRSAALVHRDAISMQHRTTTHLLEVEALMAQYASACLARSQELLLSPESIEERDADRIVRVLEQINNLLTYSMLPNIEVLLSNNYLNSGDSTDASYAGYPDPKTLRTMQEGRLSVTYYDYFLLAQMGIFTILAHRMPHEQFGRFRSVPAHYAVLFANNLPVVDDLSCYQDQTTFFAWVEGKDARNAAIQVFRTIIQGLEIINHLRSLRETVQDIPLEA